MYVCILAAGGCWYVDSESEKNECVWRGGLEEGGGGDGVSIHVLYVF